MQQKGTCIGKYSSFCGVPALALPGEPALTQQLHDAAADDALRAGVSV
jgi:hypothetical protein